MPHPADRRAAERRLFRAGPSGPLSICLVYPNTYAVGMANLGFQAVLRILAEDPRVTADRAFLPDGPRAEWPRTLRSLEQDRPGDGRAPEPRGHPRAQRSGARRLPARPLHPRVRRRG